MKFLDLLSNIDDIWLDSDVYFGKIPMCVENIHKSVLSNDVECCVFAKIPILCLGTPRFLTKF